MDEVGDTSTSVDLMKTKALEPGQLIEGRYKVLALIGRGAVGSVYEVEQVFLKKRYALKVLDPIVTSDTNIRRFQQEAQAASKMDHPNLAKALDCGVVDETQPFLVMELVEGQTLDQYLKANGKLSVPLALELFIPLCFGLGYAHSEGVIHRDIKPSNIILTPAEDGKLTPKIVDFGIAKVSLISEEEAKALTRTGEVFGTPLYMSPEQCIGSKVDGRSDIYSLGCVLFQALTQTPPFLGNTALETIVRHQGEVAPSLKEASLGEQFPEALEAIVAKMLAKKPNDRFANALDVARDLSNIQRNQTGLAETQALTTKTTIASQKPPLIPLALAGAGLAVLIGLTTYLVSHQHEEPGKSTKLVNDGAQDDARITWNTSQKPQEEDGATGFEESYPLAKDETPFSSFHGTQRLFDFPENMGFLSWREAEEFRRPAKGMVPTPKNADIIFEPSFTVYKKPSSLTRFRSNDLSGIVFSLPLVASAETCSDRPIRYLALLKSLKIVSLTNNPISDDSLESIGMLPHLEWLVLDDSYKDGDKLATLKNLSQLRILAAHNIDKATELISQLVKINKLKLLSLNVQHMVDLDLELISQLHELNTLSLLCDLPKNALEHIATMPKLTRLCIQGNTIDAHSIAFLKRMKKLEHLSVIDVSDQQLELISTLDQLKELSVPEVAINKNSAEILRKMHNLKKLHVRAASADALKPDRRCNLVQSIPAYGKAPDYVPEGHSPVFEWFEYFLNPACRAYL